MERHGLLSRHEGGSRRGEGTGVVRGQKADGGGCWQLAGGWGGYLKAASGR